MTDASVHDLEPVLCSATVRGAGLPETARATAAAGFKAISVYVSEYERARADGWSDEELRGLLTDLGLRVAEIDEHEQLSRGRRPLTPDVKVLPRRTFGPRERHPSPRCRPSDCTPTVLLRLPAPAARGVPYNQFGL